MRLSTFSEVKYPEILQLMDQKFQHFFALNFQANSIADPYLLIVLLKEIGPLHPGKHIFGLFLQAKTIIVIELSPPATVIFHHLLSLLKTLHLQKFNVPAKQVFLSQLIHLDGAFIGNHVEGYIWIIVIVRIYGLKLFLHEAVLLILSDGQSRHLILPWW